MSSKRKSTSKDTTVYREFGNQTNSDALEKGVPNLPPQQQNIRIQVTRAGKKGKTVSVISGFQHNQESLTQLLKKLKTQCGTGGTIKDNTIEIQGDHKQKLLQILSQLGYKAKVSGG
ncbi:translation initiation factor 1 (eIF-1/SUI1) [Stanieria cyanosphaera PCC 7437]|uniref:Translation initiation factor 1 (eIF-1/SUI1) n=1 Tax=Stanieria cyanosphaera (strain ATCC 29371 / PCC 7437) TaxID=111780 RepID=K9XUG0_STAC7|nr:translation initiation factor [Stanieria cyanosphaera]AFZ36240.1 translation initiation factor 1 (eIF-1/SUI1) [Stanieria cyanosphaera PCC 7437]